MMLGRVDDLVVERAVEVFSSEASNYYKAHGSWTAAREAETFFEFDARTRASFPGLSSRLESEGYPPGSPSAPTGERAGPLRGRFAFGGTPPPFVVVEQAGVVLLNLRRQRVGVVSPSERLAHAQPVVVDGDKVAQAVSLERPVLTDPRSATCRRPRTRGSTRFSWPRSCRFPSAPCAAIDSPLRFENSP